MALTEDTRNREKERVKDKEQETQHLEASRESHYLLLVYFSYIKG